MIQNRESAWLFAFDLAFVEGGIVLQPAVQPLVRLLTKREDVGVRSIVLILFHLVGGAVEVVNRSRSLVHVMIAGRWKRWVTNRAQHF